MEEFKRILLLKGLFVLSVLIFAEGSWGSNEKLAEPKKGAYPIEHFVVLMLENRAFDHMLGHLKKINPDINGLNGDESNPYRPYDPRSPVVPVTFDSNDVDPNPGHSHEATTDQTYGDANHTHLDPAPMNGFVANAESMHKGWGPLIMACYNRSSLSVLSTLATEYALFDMWFSSMPGPTEVNRMYLHSATSHGSPDNDMTKLIQGYPQDTIYQRLESAGVTFNIYMQEVTTTLFFTQMRHPKYWPRFKPYWDFESHAAAGTLPHFSFIEPRYFSVPGFPANDQHPSHAVSQGEQLIKQIYNTLIKSPQWNKTALLITYDEHGGFYDHFPPPQNHVPNPDGMNSTNPSFDFTKLGVRVPAVLVSPWIEKGSVIHAPTGPTPHSHFDHTSLAATLHKIYNFKSYLTKRDAWAGTFESVFSRSTPRTDKVQLPTPFKFRDNSLKESQQPINDLQKGFVQLASILNEEPLDIVDKLETENDGARYVMSAMKRYLRKQQLLAMKMKIAN